MALRTPCHDFDENVLGLSACMCREKVGNEYYHNDNVKVARTAVTLSIHPQSKRSGWSQRASPAARDSEAVPPNATPPQRGHLIHPSNIPFRHRHSISHCLITTTIAGFQHRTSNDPSHSVVILASAGTVSALHSNNRRLHISTESHDTCSPNADLLFASSMDQMMQGGGFPLEQWFWEIPVCTRWYI